MRGMQTEGPPWSIYHSFFKGAWVHGDRHKIARPAGRRATDAIKAHEMQMVLYVKGSGFSGEEGSAFPGPAAICLPSPPVEEPLGRGNL